MIEGLAIRLRKWAPAVTPRFRFISPRRSRIRIRMDTEGRRMAETATVTATVTFNVKSTAAIGTLDKEY